MKLGEIGQIALTVENIERATKFYEETLGIPLLFRAGGLSFFGCGSVRLMLSEPESSRGEPRPAAGPDVSAQPAPSFLIYFRVEQIDQAHRELSSGGARFLDVPHLIARMPDHELWMTSFGDGEGNTLVLMEERKF